MNAEHERLSIVIYPIDGDEANISVSSFITSIDALKKAANKFNSKDLKIVGLSCNSPATVTIEDTDNGIVFLLNDLQEFVANKIIPAHWNRTIIDAITEFLAPIGTAVGKFLLKSPEKEIKLDVLCKVDFQNQIEKDFTSYGTVDGKLDAINIHGKKNTLTLYPVVGKSKIICDFPNEHLDKIKRLIGSYVEISGQMKYRWRDKYPHSAVVNEIQEIVEDDLPNFSDLYGIAPNATHGESSEDFIARIRSEWN